MQQLVTEKLQEEQLLHHNRPAQPAIAAQVPTEQSAAEAGIPLRGGVHDTQNVDTVEQVCLLCKG